MAQMGAVALAYSLAEKQTELFRRVRRNAAARAAERGADTLSDQTAKAERGSVDPRVATAGSNGEK